MQQVLDYRQRLSSMGQYSENITKAQLHIDTVDTLLDTVTEFLYDAKNTLPIQALNCGDLFRRGGHPAYPGHSIGQFQTQRTISVRRGDLSDAQPFDAATGAYLGDAGSKEYLIGDGQQSAIIADGSEIFQGANPDDVFTVLSDLRDELALGTAADQDNINSYIGLLENAIDTITAVRAENAGRYTRLEATQNHYNYFSVNIENLMSSVEEVDLAEAIIDFQVQSTAYESTLPFRRRSSNPAWLTSSPDRSKDSFLERWHPFPSL